MLRRSLFFCVECGKSLTLDSVDTTVEQASELARRKGWHYEDDIAMCPDCFAKSL